MRRADKPTPMKPSAPASRRRLFFSAIACIGLVSCSAIDGNLSGRIATLNTSTNSARNESILLNIVRASQLEPLNFVSLSKVSGTQTSDLRIGLPTLTFGPAQTAMQRQVVFGSNSIDNSVSGSFDVAALETKDFYRGMLTPVDLATMDLLVHQGFSRELIFYILIESIRIKYSDGNAIEIRNDLVYESPRCEAVPQYYEHGSLLRIGNPYNPSSTGYNLTNNCEFSRFEYFIQQALKWGLSVETKQVKDTAKQTDKDSKDKDGKSAPASLKIAGRFCFDIAQTREDQKERLIRANAGLCKGHWTPTSDNSDERDVYIPFGNSEGGHVRLSISFRTRSTFGAFRYLGHLLRTQRSDRVVLYSHDTASITANPALLTINNGVENSCFALVEYDGIYCVPKQNAENTKQLFSLLAQLIALNTSIGDLPFTQDVRLRP